MPANTSPTFINGRSGIVNVAASAYVSEVRDPALLSDGRILANVNGGVARFNADGSADTQFGILRPPSVGNGNISTVGFKQLADGKIVIAGTELQYDGPSTAVGFAAYRVTADGSIDPAFGSGKGWVSMRTGDEDSARASLVQVDGKIIVIGTTQKLAIVNGMQVPQDSHVALVRFTADGKPDTSFGSNGIALGSNGHASAMAAVLQSDGKIVVAGFELSGNDGPQATLYRFNADGSPDKDFGVNGAATINYPVPYKGSVAAAVVLQPDGKIVVAGSAPTLDYSTIFHITSVARFNGDGTPDQSFGTNGTFCRYIAPEQDTWIPGGNRMGESSANTLVLLDDGRILVSGDTIRSGAQPPDAQFAVLSLMPDGSIDASFGNHGIATVGFGRDYMASTHGLLQTPDGKLLLTGYNANNQSGSMNYAMARLNPDGSLDQGFGAMATANTGPNSVTYHENMAAVILNANLAVHDAELDASGYAGASVTLARHGGANASDQFKASGNLLFSAGQVVLDGLVIGTASQAGGKLRIDFGPQADQTRVNKALQSIAYSNADDLQTASDITIDWTFSDGNSGAQGTGGALTAQSSTRVTLQPAQVSPWIETLLSRHAAPIGAGQALGFSTVADLRSPAFTSFQQTLLKAMAARLAGIIDIKLSSAAVEGGGNLVIHNSPEVAEGHAARQAWTGDGGDLFVHLPASGSTTSAMGEVQEQLAKLLGLRDSGAGLDLFGTMETAALQYMYGVSKSYHAGNDTYALGTGKVNFIADGAGNDTISAAGLDDPLTLHLQPGHWDYIGSQGASITDAGQFTVNYGSVIENAVGGNGNDHISGTAGANRLQGGAGDDWLAGLGGSDILDGGAGMDVASFTGKLADYTLAHGTSNGFTVKQGLELTTLANIERLQFADTAVAIDIDGNAGQVLRLYQAIFNRAPDAKGLGYWIDARDKGMALNDIAVFFTQGSEFKAMYGAEPSSAGLLGKLYQYALHREPDAAGMAFWQQLLDGHKIGLGELLTSFSESGENKAQVIGAIQDGIAYTPWLG